MSDPNDGQWQCLVATVHVPGVADAVGRHPTNGVVVGHVEVTGESALRVKSTSVFIRGEDMKIDDEAFVTVEQL